MRYVAVLLLVVLGGCAAPVDDQGVGESPSPVVDVESTEPRLPTEITAGVQCEELIRREVTRLADFIPYEDYDVSQDSETSWTVLGAYDNTATGERVRWECSADYRVDAEEWSLEVSFPE